MPLRSFREIFLPYCVIRESDGTWSVLNREYVALGENERKSHKGPTRTYSLKGLGPAALKKIAFCSRPEENTFWLYDESCFPESSAENWNAYSKRLKALMAFTTRHRRRGR